MTERPGRGIPMRAKNLPTLSHGSTCGATFRVLSNLDNARSLDMLGRKPPYVVAVASTSPCVAPSRGLLVARAYIGGKTGRHDQTISLHGFYTRSIYPGHFWRSASRTPRRPATLALAFSRPPTGCATKAAGQARPSLLQVESEILQQSTVPNGAFRLRGRVKGAPRDPRRKCSVARVRCNAILLSLEP